MRPLRYGVAALVVCACIPCARRACADAGTGNTQPEEPPRITIWAEPGNPTPASVDMLDIAAPPSDTARLLQRLPGAAVQGNGPISGLVSYRGLSGHRVRVEVDGMAPVSGGPNRMDPPLHYLPPGLLDRLELQRGIAPVSAGAGAPGGVILARSLGSRFAEGPDRELHGHADLTTSSADRGLRGHGRLAASTPRLRAHASFSRERGRDRDFDGGEVRPTRYERTSFGLGGGVRLGVHELELDARQLRTGESGTPALPLDVRFFDSKLLRLGYVGEIGDLRLRARLSGSDVDHRMDGSLRPGPSSPADARLADARGRGRGWGVDARLAAAGGELRLGADGQREEHDMRVRNPNVAAFFVDSFEDVTHHRAGAYAEWAGELGARVRVEAGVRYDRVVTDADDAALAAMLPAPAQGLAAAFNASARRRTDDNLDWALRVELMVHDRITLLLGGARKTRSPAYIERYAWIPIEATAGLADGNNHVGDPDLEPEVSHELELGVTWSGPVLRLAPRLFWREVDDYIQGVPVDATVGVVDSPVEMVSALNGDPTPLRFANVDARIIGADVSWSARLTADLRLEGVLGVARGRRRDVRDDLYRISPLSGMAALIWESERWKLELEGVFADAQRRVSVTNGEQRSSGHTLLNLRASWRPARGLTLGVALHNALDRRYREHLAGFARFEGRDVARGERLPGEGRSLIVHLRQSF